MVAIFVLVLFLTVISVDMIVLRFRGKYHPAFEPPFSPYDIMLLDKNNFALPPDTIFSKGHTWLRKNGNGTFDIGIDALSMAALGPMPVLNYVKEGSELRRGEMMLEGGVGNNKIRFLSPVSGTVQAVNQNIAGGKISDAYETWNVRVISDDPAGNRKLFLCGNDASLWMKKEFIRLKKFIDVRSPQIQTTGATMLDGGLPSDDAVSAVVAQNAVDFEKQFLSL